MAGAKALNPGETPRVSSKRRHFAVDEIINLGIEPWIQQCLQAGPVVCWLLLVHEYNTVGIAMSQTIPQITINILNGWDSNHQKLGWFMTLLYPH